ncbi:hypothetical protein IQ16_06781 [Bradyrhizobium huanghuaihaiense]|uniref:Uncharacterized protein n=1 Tax=Bradyrhizobium huanghuaihaiense TaxID=990078 RepID=A0A562R1J3_9BRAD|nr:hypothetical protein [Bradyrhizobium huanghuaihaiense]TWI62454.1 hypothetical protein IQ16_06781 [Bradyrhizobium huanghuaihaiense]
MSGVGPKEQLVSLKKSLTRSLDESGEQRVLDCQSACSSVLHWISYIRGSELSGNCDNLVDALQGGAIETAGCIAMGLVRPALFSLRSQIDLAVAWLFYKDHPVEWESVVRTGEGFLLKRDVFEHFSKYRNQFSPRLELLDKHKNRKLSDPYRVLSAHIHGQSSLVVPKFRKLHELIYPASRCDEAVKLQAEVAEYISDIFLAYFGDKWASLPSEVIASVQLRVPADKLPALFS